jgi:ABC-type dipeptide/oligopeptide/nickel transport system ATPase component
MIFQEPMTSLNPVFTIGELLSEVIQLQQRISKKTVLVNLNALLQEVGIDSSRRHAYPHEFSGGMRQRVMIAMALANKPSFLIADEPTTALDATTSKQIIQLLLTAKKNRGMSMLFISHDLRLVASISDEVYVIRSGVVVEHGTSDRVLQHPTNRYTQALLACQPLIANKIARLSTIPDDV